MTITNLFNAPDWPKDGLPKKARIAAVVSASTALLMAVLDTGVVNIVLPDLAHLFSISDSLVIWVVNIYQLAIVTTLLSFSHLGDIFGYNKVFLVGITLFIFSSALCALVDSFPLLLAARFMQGIGASAITAVNTAQLRIIYPRRLLAIGLGINAMVVSISAAAGPSIAGAVLSVASWHWLFAINIPLGILSLIIGLAFLPRRKDRAPIRFEWRTAGMNAFFFGLLIFSVECIAHTGNPFLVGLLILGTIVLGYLYIRDQRHRKTPILPLDLMSIRIFRLSVFTSVCSFIAGMMAMVALPFFFSDTLGYSAVMTGLLLTPWPLTAIIVAPIAGKLCAHIHPGYLGGIGMALLAFGLAGIGFLGTNPEIIRIVILMCISGMGFALFQTPNNTTMIGCAPIERSGAAGGMLGMARLLGQTLGATGTALLFACINGSTKNQTTFFVSSIFALFAGILSVSRLSLPSPLKK